MRQPTRKEKRLRGEPEALASLFFETVSAFSLLCGGSLVY